MPKGLIAMIETFEEQSSELYSLALLLTGDVDRSVEAFDRALDFEDQNPREVIIDEALGTIRTDLRVSKQRVARTSDDGLANARWKRRAYIGREEFEEAVIAIDAFPRCAMLLTIFEGKSIEEASALLHEDEKLTQKAQRIGIVQLTSNLAGDSGRDPYRENGRNPVPVLSLG
jgi:hypothetical protein